MRIEFEGSYNKKSVLKETALVEHPSRKLLFRRLALALILSLVLIFVVISVYETKQYFTIFALWIPILSLAIYYLAIHPYIVPYWAAFQMINKTKKENF